VAVCRHPRKKDPWLLATDVGWGSRKVVGPYALRMSVDELFRHEKNVRLGWGLRQTKGPEAGRLERLLLVSALAGALRFGSGSAQAGQ
jgi:hypothetical protein